jgi:L-iditol 2-dehydrogenase
VCHLSDLERRSWHGFDVVFECTGVVEIWEQSLKWCSRGGTVVLFGGCPVGSHAAFDTRRLHYEEVSLLGSFHFGSEAVSLAREMLLDPSFVVEPVLSGVRPLSDGPDVFKDLQAGKGVKYVLRP